MDPCGIVKWGQKSLMEQISQTFLSRFTEASPRCDITLTRECKILLTISVCQVQFTGHIVHEKLPKKTSPIITTQCVD